jgi:hypothetical protein
MTSNSALDAINPHIYGLRAAAACKIFIDEILTSTSPADLIKSIARIQQIKNRDDRNRAMQALLYFDATGDRDAAAKIITGYEYLAAHLHLGRQMHYLQMRADNPAPPPPVIIDEMPAYPVRAENYQPAVTSIIEILCETIQASNAPSAAIPAATCSI